jgi:hypothetical protein
VLSGLAVVAAITAVLAGVTGAWSPCGFSMVETIGSALGDARRGATLLASATFALGTLIGGAVTFGGLALLGQLVGGEPSGLREGLGATLALVAAIADWRGVKIAPQIRRQVPERWRWSMPLSLACGLYGILLGLGFTTFVLAFAVWALAGISFATGDPMLGVIIGVAFGVGRAVPVLWMAPALRGGSGAERLDEMASEPRLWLGLRRLDALGLGLCSLSLAGASAGAATLSNASDPAAAGARLVWQQTNGPGQLRTQTGTVQTLPGRYPALGQTIVAWEAAGAVTIADATSLAPLASIPAAGLSALAISDAWLVMRNQNAQGGETLVGVSLASPSQRRFISGSRLAGRIGRPALEGSNVAFTLSNPQRSEIVMLNLASGATRVLRAASRNAAFSNPSMLGGKLLYERTTRCVQQLLIGPATGRGRTRVLMVLPSTVRRDPGYERGYTHAYNTASLCPNRGSGPGISTQLGSTALSASAAYVTEVPSVPGDARIITLKL